MQGVREMGLARMHGRANKAKRRLEARIAERCFRKSLNRISSRRPALLFQHVCILFENRVSNEALGHMARNRVSKFERKRSGEK
eukprot:1821042-Pleurochrysis_carterae.AAC.1